MLIQQDANRFARVFAPKVRGGWLLDRLTRCDPLDWFVMFSSVAAVLGSAGQTNYAAANAFLDLLARERRTRGLPGLSINWGAWTEVGVAADRGLIDRLAAQGLGAITPSQGLVALERLLEDGSSPGRRPAGGLAPLCRIIWEVPAGTRSWPKSSEPRRRRQPDAGCHPTCRGPT